MKRRGFEKKYEKEIGIWKKEIAPNAWENIEKRHHKPLEY